MRNTSRLLIIFQISYLAIMVLSIETVTEVPVVEKQGLDNLFSNVTRLLQSIKDRITLMSKILSKDISTNSSESTDVENIDVNFTRYNGTYDSIIEKVEKFKNKLKEIRSTLQTLSLTVDSERGEEE